MKKIQILSLLICLLCSLLVFASCKDTASGGTETGTQEKMITNASETPTGEVTGGGNTGGNGSTSDSNDTAQVPGETSGSNDTAAVPGMTPGADADGGSYNQPTPIF